MIWYVAYGSNLAGDRMRCYLAGGRPAGAARTYTGCRDPRPARADRAVELDGGIYFAARSSVWGGGIAFYDPALPARTAARAYLLTPGQFADVVAQETHRDDLGDLDLTEALATGGQRLGPGRYETVLRVGTTGGLPMLTFTSPQSAAEAAAAAALNPPSAGYLATLARGLRESHRWPAGRIATYLSGCPGARGSWPEPAVTALMG